jgi:hypothetical protein
MTRLHAYFPGLITDWNIKPMRIITIEDYNENRSMCRQ